MDTDLFIRNVKAKCAELNTTPTVACKESGAGKSLISNMKNGEIPSIIRVEMLASFLNCTVSDLLGEAPPGQKEGLTPVTESEPLDPMTAQLMDLVRQLTPDSKKMLIAQLKVLLSTQ